MSFSWLPETLAEIAELVGLEAALKLAESQGGTVVNIPRQIGRRKGREHWLEALLGREAAEKICREYGGLKLNVPLGPHGTIARARRKLARELASGASPREAARRAGLTERTAWRTRAAMRGKPPTDQV